MRKISSAGKIKTTLVLLVTASILAGCSQARPLIKLRDVKYGDICNQKDNYQQPRRTNVAKRSAPRSITCNKHYFVVGTYPNLDQATDAFLRVNSIGSDVGLPVMMWVPMIKTGKELHMVRLGPFTRRAQIDKIKGRLMNEGLMQFKVAEKIL